MAIRITRMNPRTGQVERPWRNRDHVFVLGDPAHGARKHHDRFAVKVATIEEVAAHIGRGFSVRMTDGESPPSLIAPDSLTVEPVDDSDPTPLWVNTAARPPFAKDEMMAELKRAMLVQANQIAHAGKLSFALAFMGFETINPVYPYLRGRSEAGGPGPVRGHRLPRPGVPLRFPSRAILGIRRRHRAECGGVHPRRQSPGEQW